MEKKVIVIGGGWSGIAAAIAAKKCGADVTIVEKTDLMLGLGNVGGIMRNNGRFTAAVKTCCSAAPVPEEFLICSRINTIPEAQTRSSVC